MANGITQPMLFQTDQGFYVVKNKSNVEGPRVLINEFVCYKLAKILNLPIPDAALINLNQSTIDTDPSLQKDNISPGIHFGSKFIPKSQTSIQPPLVDLVINKDDIPSIILFDQIVYNDDRTLNKGNLLIDLKEKMILAIDHSHTFKNGAIWDKYELERINKEPICLIKDFHGVNYKVLLKYVNGNSPFNKVLQKISKIKRKDINWCFEQIPEEWNLDKADELALNEFIWHRITNTHEFLTLIQDQCPNWKGGDLFEE